MSKPNKALIREHAQTMARAAFERSNQDKRKAQEEDPTERFLQSVGRTFEHLKAYQCASLETFKMPKTKNKDRLFMQMLRHCFVKYVVSPRWYDACAPLMSTNMALYENKLDRACGTFCAHPDGVLPIFLTLATGGSVHKAHFSKYLTKKETHAFLTCPHQECNLAQALVYAIAKCAGANEGCALRLARSRLPERFQIKDSFWIECIRFFAKDTPESIATINDLLDYLRSQKAQDPAFTIVGRGYTTKTLERRMKDWHYALAREKAFGNATWSHCLLENYTMEVPSKYHNHHKEIWEFKQITSAQDLAKEGTAMRHCVASYLESCKRGSCAIWSLRCDGDRKLTIELRLDHSYDPNPSIVQVRGLANRVATEQERQIVQAWAKAFDLSMSSKYIFRY